MNASLDERMADFYSDRSLDTWVKQTESYVRTAALLAQGNVEIGLIKLRPPPYGMTAHSLTPKPASGSVKEKIDMQKRYISLLEKGLIDTQTFKALLEKLDGFQQNTMQGEAEVAGYQ